MPLGWLLCASGCNKRDGIELKSWNLTEEMWGTCLLWAPVYTQDDTTHLNFGSLEFCPFPLPGVYLSPDLHPGKRRGNAVTSKFKTGSSLFSPLFQMNQLLSLQCVCLCVCVKTASKTQAKYNATQGRDQHSNMAYKITLTHPNWICAFGSGREGIIT